MCVLDERLRAFSRDCLNQDLLDLLDFQDGECLAGAGGSIRMLYVSFLSVCERFRVD